MNGFIVTISLNGVIPEIEYSWKSLFDFQPAHIIRSLKSDNVQFEQFTAKKFVSEKLWIDNSDYFIVTDGLITNIDILKKTYKTNDVESLIHLLYEKCTDFFSEFTGNFVGIFWNKHNNSITAFNNQTGTKKLFYYKSDTYSIFSTDLYTLSRTLDQLNIRKTIDIEASYLLLTSGFMHENYTLLTEVKQIIAGEYGYLFEKKLNIQSYYNLRNIEENKDTENQIIDKLDKLFKEALETEFEFDKKHNLIPLTTLSGGLDSRMVALFAHDLEYTNQQLLNFSEKGYADEVIAKQIAQSYSMKLTQIPLSSKGLLAIDDVVKVNDGLTLYSGAGHAFEALRKLKFEQSGILHTGMIGDAVLGSFLSGNHYIRPAFTSGLYSIRLLSKVKETLERSMLRYENEVLYKFYNRAFLGANNGFLYYDLSGESMSPFLYPAFLSYALSIPPKYCYKEHIYIKWIMSKHPEYAHFVWEAIGGKPTNNKLIRLFFRYKKAVLRRLPIHTMWKNNMNPEQLWYDNDSEVKTYLDNYYKDHIHLFEFNKELMNDMMTHYEKGGITEKTQVLTLLSAHKLLL